MGARAVIFFILALIMIAILIPIGFAEINSPSSGGWTIGSTPVAIAVIIGAFICIGLFVHRKRIRHEAT